MDPSIEGKWCGCCRGNGWQNALGLSEKYGYFQCGFYPPGGVLLACEYHFETHVNHALIFYTPHNWNAVLIDTATGKPLKQWKHKAGEPKCEPTIL